MNLKEKHEDFILSKAISQNATQLISILENGDQVKEYFAIDLTTKEMFAKDIDFKKIELECQKSERKHIAITMLKSVLTK